MAQRFKPGDRVIDTMSESKRAGTVVDRPEGRPDRINIRWDTGELSTRMDGSLRSEGEPDGAAKAGAFIVGGLLGIPVGASAAVFLTILFPPMIIVSWLLPLMIWRAVYNMVLGRDPNS